MPARRPIAVALTALLMLTAVAGAQTTRPAAGRPAARAAAAGLPGLERLQERIATLDLSPEQKQQFQALKDSMAERVRAMAPQLKGASTTERREMIRAEFGDVREKFLSLLTPEQKAKLREAGPIGGGANRRGPATRPGRGAANVTINPDTATAAPASQPAAVIGQPAPAFALKRLNGTEITNRTFAGRPVVLVFGSLTSPSFRDRLPRLIDLKNKVRSRAALAIVYTREAHPSDGWQVERNRDDNIEFPQPTTAAERLALAGKLKDQLGGELDVLADDMDDATLTAFGSLSDGAVVIGPTGKLVAAQKYCDPSGLPRLIDLALKDRS